MRGNNEKRGRVTQVDRVAWHRTEEEKLLMMIKIFCVKIQRWQSDLVSLRSSKHQSEAGQIKDPTMRSSLMIEPKHLIFRHTKIPSLKILECGVKELPCHKQFYIGRIVPTKKFEQLSIYHRKPLAQIFRVGKYFEQEIFRHIDDWKTFWPWWTKMSGTLYKSMSHKSFTQFYK